MAWSARILGFINSTKLTLFVILFATGLNSCAAKLPDMVVGNPMQAAWGVIAEEINELERTHAAVAEWRRGSESAVLVNSEEELLALVPSGLSNKLVRLEFARSAKVIHFGFECDYHALVFFDGGGRAREVFKW